MTINNDNETLKNYKGLIRNIETLILNTIARVKKLEEKIAKIPISSSGGQSNLSMFSDVAEDKGYSSNTEGQIVAEGGSGGGLSSAEIKSLITNWIKEGELPIPVHDHTDNAKGGDAYANKGAALQ